jgi:hypothetical protein
MRSFVTTLISAFLYTIKHVISWCFTHINSGKVYLINKTSCCTFNPHKYYLPCSLVSIMFVVPSRNIHFSYGYGSLLLHRFFLSLAMQWTSFNCCTRMKGITFHWLVIKTINPQLLLGVFKWIWSTKSWWWS